MAVSVRRASVGALALALATLGSTPGAAVAQGRGWASRLPGPRARAALSSQDAEQRREAVRDLAREGDPRLAVEALAAAFEREDDPALRVEILDALARRGDRSVVARIVPRLPDLAEGDRRAALRALGALGGDAATRALVEWLGAADVGDEARAGLVRVGPPAVSVLLNALGTSEASVRAAQALGRIGDTRAVEPLASGLARAPAALRVASLDALAAIGDERAAPSVAACLTDPSPAVVSAALRALALLAGPELAAPVAALADRGTSAQRAQALTALARMDPDLAAPRLGAALGAIEDPALGEAAAEILLEEPAAVFVPLLVELARDPSRRTAAAEALARVSDGAGLAALVALAQADDAGALDLPLALALRRHPDPAAGEAVGEARRILRDRGDLSALALAGASEAVSAGLDALADPTPLRRLEGALALWLAPEAARVPADRVARALAAERDAPTFRVLALVCLDRSCRVHASDLERAARDPATAPEALWVAAANLRGAVSPTRGRVRRTLRRALRSPEPRVRAGAALALAIAGEASAWGALRHTLADPHETVRLAAARALSVLAVEAARPAVAERARIEPDPRVRAVLAEALSREGRPPAAFARGTEALYVRVVTARGLSDVARSVDVVLGDGRWLRLPVSGAGAVIVPGLPAGEADVQVRLGAP